MPTLCIDLLKLTPGRPVDFGNVSPATCELLVIVVKYFRP